MSVVVLDNGTALTKCGFAGDNFPTAVFPTILGRPVIRSGEEVKGFKLKDLMIGEEAAPARAALEISYPFNNGMVKDWDEMTLLWNYTFKSALSVTDFAQSKLLVTEPPQNSRKHREQMAEIFFEKFGFGSLYFGIQATMALYGQGITTGIAVDSGDTVTQAVPVYEGRLINKAIKRINLGGKDITEYLIKLLLRRGYVFNKTADFETVRQIKEKCCYVGCDMKLERTLADDTTVLEQKYTLPDNSSIFIGTERFEAPEVLFDPFLVEKEGGGLSEMVYSAVKSSDIDVRKELYSHIVLCGGSTMFPGLPTRIFNELNERHLREALKGDTSKASKYKWRIEDDPRRKYNVFTGAAVYASLISQEGNQEHWIAKEDYDEARGNAIWAKCE